MARGAPDYCHFNQQTIKDKYTLSNIADLATHLDSSTIFSKLDLRKGYFQVPITTDNIAKMVIITPFGLFEFVRMPFGLLNAGMTFQHRMDTLLGKLLFALIYLHDILIASTDGPTT
jgi:hypothetical protein